MAPTKHVDITAVWGALVELIQELTKLAKNANRAVERDLHPMREVERK